jgi:periplasmic protein CpxP/Spy
MTSPIKSVAQSVLGSLVLLSLMAGAGFPSYAQTTPAQPRAHQERAATRQAELKALLQLTTAQEPAWNTFVASMMPHAERAALRAEIEKLPEAERRSKMKALRAQRDANVDAFYAVLNADQKKIFDEQRKHRGHGRGQG